MVRNHEIINEHLDNFKLYCNASLKTMPEVRAVKPALKTTSVSPLGCVPIVLVQLYFNLHKERPDHLSIKATFRWSRGGRY